MAQEYYFPWRPEWREGGSEVAASIIVLNPSKTQRGQLRRPLSHTRLTYKCASMAARHTVRR